MASKKGGPQSKHLKTLTSSEAREHGRAGGLASARARQEKKTMKETLEILMKIPLQRGPIHSLAGVESLTKEDIAEANPVAGELLALAMLQKALKGDTKAMRIIMEMTGEGTPAQNVSPLDGLAETLKQYEDYDEQ